MAGQTLKTVRSTAIVTSKNQPALKKNHVWVVVGLTVIVGIMLVARFFAAGVPVGFEAETGTLANCATTTTDANASGGSAVKFSGCVGSSDTTTPMNLDKTGATIPDSNYPIPTGAIFMATTGSDTNPGTQAAPVKTLTVAINKVPSGGTIVVRGGTDASPAVYRDWHYLNNTTLGIKTFGTITKPLTIQAYPHEKAWFDGTDIVPTASWVSDGVGHWSVPWDTPSFCGTLYNASRSNYYSASIDSQRIGATGSDGKPEGTVNGPCAWKDASKDPANPMALDPQMAFIDGTYVHQVPTLAEATGANFYYDWSAKRLYIGTNPAGHTVELAARPMAFMLFTSGSTIRGIGFTRYASHVYSNNPGTIYSAGTQTFENVVFSRNAGIGLVLSNPHDATVNHAVFANNGGQSIGGNGSRATGGTDNVTIQNSYFNGSNSELFWTNCTYSCSQASIKLSNMIGYTIKNNILENGRGNAIAAWCDIACTNGKFLYNRISTHGGYGILPEISDTTIIASNLVYKNGRAGVSIASAHTKMYNNTIVDNVTNPAYNWMGQVWIYDDPRSPGNLDTGGTGATAAGPDTVGTYYANNILSGPSPMSLTRVQGTNTTSTNTLPSEFFDLFDYNAYFRKGGAAQPLVFWNAAPSDGGTVSYTSASAFNAAHPPFDAHSIDISSGTDPFFVNAAADDYHLRSGGQAGTGTAIPADVLAALGLTSGSGLPKGAINWPGK